MPNIGPAELIVILVVALLVLGPKKLPEVGKSLGKGIREFKDSMSGDGAGQIGDSTPPHEQRAPASSQVGATPQPVETAQVRSSASVEDR